MSSDAWNPCQYEKFRDERARPFHDLLALVDVHGGRVVDLGCGTGELTRTLHETVGAAETLGVDSSASMLARAPQAPGLRFRVGTVEAFDEGGWDLLFSNAALQWVDDHPALFARLAALLAPGGRLAVQMPANHHHPSHVVAAEVASEEPFRAALGGWVRLSPVLAIDDYARLLDGLGLRDLRVRLEVYVHHLDSREGVVEWVKGTLLTDYERRMPPELFARFLEAYRARLLPRLEDARPFTYPFKRVLLVGRR